MRQRVPTLIAAGAIESVGRGKGQKFLLSRALYEAIGESGVHTRKRGLDHHTKRALLARHLREAGDAGAPMADLRQVLPADNGRAVLRLLQELRAAGLAELRGLGRFARWFATPALRQNGSPVVFEG